MLIRVLLFKAALLMAAGLSAGALAETTAFGMTLGKTTGKEVKALYPGADDGFVNKWTGGTLLKIPVRQVKMDDLNKFTVLLDEENKVTAISLELKGKQKFDYFYPLLAKKYQVVKKVIPFVGDKFVRYSHGEDAIELNSPHLSFEVSLLYIQKKTEKLMDREQKKAANRKKQQDASQL